MRAHVIAVVIAAGLAVAGFVPFDLARAQSSANEFEAKAIGKVVTANGSVDHRTYGRPVVVQAATGGDGQAKVGDFVYQGDVVQTGSRVRSALSSSTVPPSILRVMPASL